MMLEICCFNIKSCHIAQHYGADRIELCDNPMDGGTTPSAGFIEAAREILSIDVYPIIRPRGGDFLYDGEEFEIMCKDVQVCKKLGCDGVVIGMLDSMGAVDTRRISQLVALAYPMEVTFHRAFDRAADPMAALEAVINTTCTRILTSGQRPTAPEGSSLIADLLKRADGRIIIMPGSGVRASNLASLIESSGATEFHSTARIMKKTQMDFINDAMHEDPDHIICDGDEIQRMKAVLAEIRNDR